MGKQWKQCQTLFFGGSKITADGDCHHEIKRRLLLGRKAMTNLDSVLKIRDSMPMADSCWGLAENKILQSHYLSIKEKKSRDITLPTTVHIIKAIIFPVVVYGCESWIVKKAVRRRIDAFELWCWRRLLRVPWTARRSNQCILKEISPGCSF